MPKKKLPFAQVRNAHRREMAEDYVEMIQDLLAEHGEARVSEVARRFGVSTVTAHKIIARLQREKWIVSRPYRSLFLTPQGKRLAAASKKRHQIVYDFLISLGVPESTALLDAEGIEHHVSPKTLAIFQRFTKTTS